MKKGGAVIGLLALCCMALQCRTITSNDPARLLSPSEAIANFQIEGGFEVQTVVAEPLVEDPVAVQFDEDGAMWVVEMRGYMQDKEGRGEDMPLGRIKVVQDKDDDGRYETTHIFLDSLIMPRAVAIVQGGLLVIEPPNLFFVENRNGTPGARILIDSAFAEGGNVEHQPNGLMRAMDNWIYSAKSNKRVRLLNGKWVVEKTQFRGQWGITQDNWGRLYYNDNSTTLLGDQFVPNVFGENTAYRRQGKSYNVPMVSNRVFPSRSTAGVNRGYERGTLDSTKKLVNVTAACGPVVYRGDNFPQAYQGNAFVMEPSAYLIKRIVLSEDAAGFVHGAFAYENKEFLTANDERFRPVSAYTAPDGTLYFVDMHRGIIQHTTYLTPYLRQYIDSLKLERPISMGRIYRIKWKDHKLSKKLRLSAFTTPALVQLLQHKNGWYRDMAQRLLVERCDTTVHEDLRKLALNADPVPALHALYTLEGLDLLTPAFLQQVAETTTFSKIYITCMKLLEGFPADKNALRILKTLAQKSDRLVQLQYTNSLPHFAKAFPTEVRHALKQQVQAHVTDTLFLDAFMGSAAGREQQWLAQFRSKNGLDTTLERALKNAIAKRVQSRMVSVASFTKKEAELYHAGENAYKKFCATCHGGTGEGIQNVAPPLAGSQWVVQKDISIPIKILLDGLYGPVEVAGKQYAPPEYTGTMPGLRNNIETNNGMIASVLTYVRNAWGNRASAITVDEVADIRKKTGARQQPYTADELKSPPALNSKTVRPQPQQAPQTFSNTHAVTGAQKFGLRQ